MSLEAYLRLFLSVLGDWRVIAAALGTLFAWVVLRYVGLIYRRPPRRRLERRPPAGPAKRKAAPKAEEEGEAGELD